MFIHRNDINCLFCGIDLSNIYYRRLYPNVRQTRRERTRTLTRLRSIRKRGSGASDRYQIKYNWIFLDITRKRNKIFNSNIIHKFCFNIYCICDYIGKDKPLKYNLAVIVLSIVLIFNRKSLNDCLLSINAYRSSLHYYS